MTRARTKEYIAKRQKEQKQGEKKRSKEQKKNEFMFALNIKKR